MSFLYHLELGSRETLCHHLALLTYVLGGGDLEPRGGAVPDYPNLAHLKLPLRDNIPKILFSGCWREGVHLQ
jgi:hypothetical protein